MPNIARTHAGKVIANPSAFFESPMDLVKSGQLTQAEKKQALETWDLNARLMAIASEEGMSGGEPSQQDGVAEALIALNIEPDRPAGPTKLG